jgi:transcriptional regulator with XRE-family HTH domain
MVPGNGRDEGGTQTMNATQPQADYFGLYLRDMRKKSGHSQRSLAEATGRDFTYICKIERSVLGPPSDDVLSTIASVLDLDRDEVFWMAGKLPPDFRDLILEAGPQVWGKLREHLGRGG